MSQFISHVHRRSCGFILGWALVIFPMLGGCESQDVPKTYPIKGKVVLENGQPLAALAGMPIEFESVADPLIHAYGEINADGTFTVSTQTLGVAQDGIVEGQHRIRILVVVEQNDDRPKKVRGPVASKFLSFDSSELTCSAPHDGELILKVHK